MPVSVKYDHVTDSWPYNRTITFMSHHEVFVVKVFVCLSAYDKRHIGKHDQLVKMEISLRVTDKW